jgi:glutathione S-transferase
MTAVLYAIPASHPCAVVERALQLKDMPYRRVDLVPVAHKLSQRLRFGASTVPGVAFDDGARVSGSRAILRELDGRVPEPALLPVDGPARAAVERAEEWGDVVFQAVARRIVWSTLRRAPGAVASYLEGARPPLPAPVARTIAPFMPRLAQRVNGATDAATRTDLLGADAHLARVDRWIAEGVLGGETLNAADLQIASSLRLLLTLDDVAPMVDAHPAGALARRVFAEYPGRVAAGALPPGWVPAPENGGQ